MCIRDRSHLGLPTQFLKELDGADARAYVGLMPLTDEGSFLRVISSDDRLDEQDASRNEGQVVFIPKGRLFWHPATLLRSGGFRTGPNGNPRMQFVFILLPSHKLRSVEGNFQKWLDQEPPKEVYVTQCSSHRWYSSAAALTASHISV